MLRSFFILNPCLAKILAFDPIPVIYSAVHVAVMFADLLHTAVFSVIPAM